MILIIRTGKKMHQQKNLTKFLMVLVFVMCAKVYSNPDASLTNRILNGRFKGFESSIRLVTYPHFVIDDRSMSIAS